MAGQSRYVLACHPALADRERRCAAPAGQGLGGHEPENLKVRDRRLRATPDTELFPDGANLLTPCLCLLPTVPNLHNPNLAVLALGGDMNLPARRRVILVNPEPSPYL